MQVSMDKRYIVCSEVNYTHHTVNTFLKSPARLQASRFVVYCKVNSRECLSIPCKYVYARAAHRALVTPRHLATKRSIMVVRRLLYNCLVYTYVTQRPIHLISGCKFNSLSIEPYGRSWHGQIFESGLPHAVYSRCSVHLLLAANSL